LNGQKEITRELAMDHGACFSLYVMHFADKYVWHTFNHTTKVWAMLQKN
jgi:hypothetical protein